MTGTEPIWEVRNASGERTECYITAVGGGHLLRVERDGDLVASERHDVRRTAMHRARAIYAELLDTGWTPVTHQS
jgi:hypothetical protein